MILYNPSMALDMRDFGISIPIEADKHKMVYDALKAGVLRDNPEALWLRGPEFFAEITQEDLLRVHSPGYVERVFSPGEVDKEVIAALELHKKGAGRTGFACFLGGGNYHAQRDYGIGFCIFNDVVVSLRRLQAEKSIRTAWVVDIDAHKGDGTAALTWGILLSAS